MRTIKELVEEAHDYEYSKSVPIRVYMRTAENLSRHADLYLQQKANGDAYVLYLRFLDLLTNKISKNPQLKKGTADYKTYLKLLSQKAPLALQNAETIKKALDEEIKSYERYNQIRAEQQNVLLQSKKSELSSQPEPEHYTEENTFEEHDDFDEEKFANRLKQFQGYDQDSNAHSLTASYPTLEHSLSPTPQPQLQPQPLIPNQPPLIPPKQSLTPYSPPSLPPKSEPITTDSHPQVTKPSNNITPQHRTLASTESGKPLKTVYLPSQLPLRFLEIAQKNTARNLETCGILCGSLSLGAFFITTLLIPSQESTSNTCETLHEEDIFGHVDSNDLFVLGWIHTHPTQSCFLSSVDLHTQNSYQIMLPEALAIVCAVKHGEMGQFRLTDPPGIGIITKCQRSGFHPHEEKGIYKHCENKFGGHVMVKDGLPFEVVDLRK